MTISWLDRHLALGRLLAPITQPGQDTAALARWSQVERLITAVASGNVHALETAIPKDPLLIGKPVFGTPRTLQCDEPLR